MPALFDAIQTAPDDPILGLTEAFKRDAHPQKINLGVGVYKDADGQTPILASVKEAERRLAAADGETTKSYLPIEGDPTYGQCVRELLFAGQDDLIPRAATAHTPGGTGALRVAADYLHRNHPGTTVWLSEPTWPNHPSIFAAADVPTRTYPWFDPDTNGLAIDRLLDGLRQARAGDVVLLHGCCHNPTGVDPTPQQWQAIADVLVQRELVPLVDFAYQGFADGIAEDAAGLTTIAQRVPELLVCSSFSKNFGLYNERVGALSVVAGSPEAAAAVMSHLKIAIRRNYSNPPAHGGKIVATILTDSELRRQWEAEVAGMRDRINAMRKLFVETLENKGAQRDFSFIARQRGMFSFSGLTKDQVQALREKHSVYIVGSGRISVAGMTETNMPRLCEAIVDVL